MSDILTVTLNPALDVSTETAAVVPDRKLRCAAPRVQAGGGGVNVSRAIAYLGGSSRTLVAVGGATGEELTDLLRAEGLDPVPLGVSHPTRHSFSVLDLERGGQYRFVLPGPAWSAADADAARAALAAAVAPDDIVVLSGSAPPGLEPGYVLALDAAVRARGGRTVLDTSGAALRAAAEARCGLFTLRIDLEEAADLVGRRLAEIDDVAAVAADLAARGVAETVMIAAGALGTVIATPGRRCLTRPPLVRPLSKVGAGDSFVAGYALALARDADPVAACVFGTAAAASAVTTPDTDLCDRVATERYAQEVTVRDLGPG